MAAMADMAMAMPQMTPWDLADFVLTFLMWAVMMVAMMVPSASPMILTFATINRKRLADETPLIRTGLFLVGYLLVWAGYSLLAALGQWGLHAAALLSPAMAAAPWVGGILVMGLRHGAFCVGCCWVLMALLFVAGVMNLLWVAAIAAFVLLEKVAPLGRVVSRLAGTTLILWGAWLLVRAV